ncbi:hypothetical protein JOD63_001198 [Microbacterium terrae]|uniref:Uncharacterized protein n=1 Tax=Microbacterium terrae TaxID=69369 RepID=A0A0M2HJM2_9MICO|nr:hypothetical protein [Microbacterium terrae]KJL45033.1 hypothetical protein RS81_00343 [Microbacterium terrae]MBP1077230.1 hypothetical protein [Microbacterium terrae]GLJ99823.1 hypothetical protein GCM10017594_30210 [Microbacterium terrae]
MTAIAAPRPVRRAGSVRTTRFERTLLTTAAFLDHVVAVRVERRAATRPIRSAVAGDATDARTTAQALASIGILPR